MFPLCRGNPVWVAKGGLYHGDEVGQIGKVDMVVVDVWGDLIEGAVLD